MTDTIIKMNFESLAHKVYETNKSFGYRTKDKSAGHHRKVDNLPPNKNDIVQMVKSIIKKK